MLSARDNPAIAVSPQQGRLQLSPGRRRIVFVLPNNSEFGGLEKHLLDLIGMLLGYDNAELAILCFGLDIFTKRLHQEWSSRVTVRTATEPTTLSAWIKLFRQLHPDIVVFCYGWIASFPWEATLAAMLAGVRRRFAIQHLVLPPLPPAPQGKGLRGKLRLIIGQRARKLFGWRFAALISTKTICVSDAVRDSLLTSLRFPSRRTITVHNGVSVAAFVPSKRNGLFHRTQLGIDSEEFLLVCAARLSEAKGLDILLQAVSGAIRGGVSCKCIVVGDGPLREKLLQQVEDLQLAGYVHFLGFKHDVRPYLQAASAFILTSHLEGLPLSVLEAMACGLPCIVTNVGGSAEAVRHGINGLVISPGSVEEAEKAIVHLATHGWERLQMASRARKIACESFDIERQMKALVAVLLA